MEAGQLVAEQFEIVRLAGAGGMGRVFEARDRATGATVALKLLNEHGTEASERFLREAQVLASLRHPGVVRHLAHGLIDDEPYLVMEWLAGEPLSARLRRETLGVAESVALARQIATTLGAVHRAGLVHRDLKPSNIFLVHGALEQIKLIDFGIARDRGFGPRLTAAGAMVGTPGYVAPEQVRGEPDVDARADVFSLGCVLFRCLTGQGPFAGDDAVSVLFKVMLDEPPRLAHRAGIPRDLDDLLARFLAKERDARPLDGDAAAAQLEALAATALDAARIPAASEKREIADDDRRMMCLLLAHHRALAARPETPTGGSRLALSLGEVAKRHGGRIEVLAEDAILVLFADGAPTDLAAKAARCALALRTVLHDAAMAVVTGRAEMGAGPPAGEILERAAQLLGLDPRSAGDTAADAAALWRALASKAAARSDDILVDGVTAALLGTRFDLSPEGEEHKLQGERDASEPVRLLLGRPTTCVGRDGDLGALLAVFHQVSEDSSARAALITAPAGMGKSRLRYELLRRLRERGEPFDLWIGHGDPMGAGSAFGLLARALRGALRIDEGDPIEARRAGILRQTRSLPDGERVAAFLGELVGVPFAEEDNAQLGAARREPVLMGDQMRGAALDLLRAACTERPVLLLLEDLQWGDLPTVSFVDAALRNLSDLPLMVLALGRPEVHTIFPQLWAERSVQTISLGPLPRRAAERLIQQALGAVPPERVDAIIERAEGNPFYLEELIRAVAAGRDGELPETVLAMVQARLEGLDPELRRLLRAASVFGRTFSRAGVRALLGGGPLGRRLDQLVERELIIRRAEVDPACTEYAFRHALVREAVYGMFLDDDRAVGHALAGAWLEGEDRAEAMVLAEHFERGRDPERAATWFLQAAKLALEGNDLGAAIERAERAATSGARGSALGEVHLVQAEAHLWRGELALAEARANAAGAALAPGDAAWFHSVTQAFWAAGKLGAVARADEIWGERLLHTAPVSGAESARVSCLSSCAAELALSGRLSASDALLEAARLAGGDPPTVDAEALGHFLVARAFRAAVAGDPSACRDGLEAALAELDQAGDRRNVCSMRANLGFLLTELGDFVQAEASLRAALDDADRMGLHELRATTLQNLGHVVMHVGRLEESRRLLEQALTLLCGQGHARGEGGARTYLAQLALLSGDLVGAEREARAAAGVLVMTPVRAAALALLGRALLRQGRVAEALAAVEEAFDLLEAAGGALEEGESLVRLAHVEALVATGRHDAAARALAVAQARVLARAAGIRDPSVRERFLAAVPENAAILAGSTR